jgi:hypothetical protein
MIWFRFIRVRFTLRENTRIVVFSETVKEGIHNEPIKRITVQLKFFKRKVGIMGLRLGPGCGVSHEQGLKLTMSGHTVGNI